MTKDEAVLILKEFQKATPHWLKAMSWLEKYAGGEGGCPFCGMRPEKVQQLAEAVKTLKLN